MRGCLGQVVVGTGSSAIKEAVRQILVNFATVGLGASPGSKSPQCCVEELVTNVRNSVEMLTTDAASDEQLAMARLCATWFPNARVSKDITHGTRRPASKPCISSCCRLSLNQPTLAQHSAAKELTCALV
jgi:hypothetical protein